ncbi:DNA replication and repair protein RecF [Acidithiobacillus acidisediminis]|jgi:DNA replication and repair protein RecF|uniref:DNA replication/repair protein RecF n=1 Tax=Acidithiobacillus TaxID=119977 RepID=UPI00200EF7C2|nr:DNA replication and repair protein RecF [Acidithiobacillus sp. S30A2]
MPVVELQIENLRSISQLRLHPQPGWNWLIGANGVGKSTVLEALHLLAMGQSWRRGQRQLIRDGSEHYLLGARLSQGNAGFVGMRRQGEQRELSRDGERIHSAWELLDTLPLQAWHEGNAHFVSAPAEERRRILDWGLYYADRGYGSTLRAYRHALKQRNAALRQGLRPEAWNSALLHLGTTIQQQRETHLHALQGHFQRIWAAGPQAIQEVDFVLHPGWTGEFAEALERDLALDRQFAYTHSGPHRARLQFRAQRHPAAEQLSRGQLRLLGIAFRLAQIAAQQEAGAALPVILIDDFAAELDAPARHWWMQELQALHTQIFAASTEDPEELGGNIFRLHAGHLIEEIQ